jgi:polar amino acid transport system substrate-binding protein
VFSRACAAVLLISTAAVSLAGCGIPRDPNDALENIRQHGVLRAGYTKHEPWVTDAGGVPTGPEADVVAAFAHSLGARVEWRNDSESRLFEALERFELDVVVGGLTADNPAAPKLGATRPYVEVDKKQHIAAVAPGENRLLMEFERALRAHAPAVAARVGGKPVS